MKLRDFKNKTVLGILFLLPVTFLLFLYPSTNNYDPLDIVQSNIKELSGFTSKGEQVILEGNITILAFLGREPNKNALTALNLKELIYDKFKGFKKFQIVALVQNGSDDKVSELKKELNLFEELKYWHFGYGDENEIQEVFNSLKSDTNLNENKASSHVFIVDKERNQRGRLDDREDNEKDRNKPIYPLYSYDCIEVAELKNKMASEDMRVLFTEYRQKRKGNFNTDSRRERDLKANNEKS